MHADHYPRSCDRYILPRAPGTRYRSAVKNPASPALSPHPYKHTWPWRFPADLHHFPTAVQALPEKNLSAPFSAILPAHCSTEDPVSCQADSSLQKYDRFPTPARPKRSPLWSCRNPPCNGHNVAHIQHRSAPGRKGSSSY